MIHSRGLERPSVGSYCFFSSFPTRYSVLILYLPAPVLELAISSRSPDSIYGRKVFRNKDLDVRCAYCCWGATVSRPFQQSEPGTISKYTTLHIQTYLHFCIYLPTRVQYLHTVLFVGSLTLPSQNTGFLFFLSFLIYWGIIAKEHYTSFRYIT